LCWVTVSAINLQEKSAPCGKVTSNPSTVNQETRTKRSRAKKNLSDFAQCANKNLSFLQTVHLVFKKQAAFAEKQSSHRTSCRLLA